MKSSELILLVGVGYLAFNSLSQKVGETAQQFTPAGLVDNAGDSYAEYVRASGKAVQTIGQSYNEMFSDFLGGFHSFGKQVYSGFKRAF